jgi:hypothetical protein
MTEAKVVSTDDIWRAYEHSRTCDFQYCAEPSATDLLILYVEQEIARRSDALAAVDDHDGDELSKQLKAWTDWFRAELSIESDYIDENPEDGWPARAQEYFAKMRDRIRDLDAKHHELLQRSIAGRDKQWREYIESVDGRLAPDRAHQ